MVQTQTPNQNNSGLPTQEQLMAMNQMQPDTGRGKGLLFGVAVPTLAGVGAAYGAQRYLTNRAMEKTPLPNLGKDGTMLERLEVLKQRDPKTIDWMVEQEVAAQRTAFIQGLQDKSDRKFTAFDLKAAGKKADGMKKDWASQARKKIGNAIAGVGEEYNTLLEKEFEQRSYVEPPFTLAGDRYITDFNAFEGAVDALNDQLKANIQKAKPNKPLEQSLSEASGEFHRHDAFYAEKLSDMRDFAKTLGKQGKSEELDHVNTTIKQLEEKVVADLEAKKAVVKELAAEHVLKNMVGNMDVGSSTLRQALTRSAEIRGKILEEFTHMPEARMGELEGKALESAERLGAGRVTALVVAGVGGTALVSKVVNKVRDFARPSNDVMAVQSMGRVQTPPQVGMGAGTFA